MNAYLNILEEKAKKIGADISKCGYDKECIKNTLAKKVKTNLENEDINTIKQKAIEIEATITKEDKASLLDAIENRVKEILEEENERYSSIEVQQNFIPLDFG